MGASGSIKVEGNNSYAMSIESALNGNLSMLGALSVVGDNTYGLRTTGAIDGNVTLAGSIAATGLNARGASLEGDISGGVKVRSSIATTGYRYTTPPPARPTGWTSEDKNTYLEDLDANDLLQGGPALTIAANIAKGVLLAVDYDDKGEPVAGQTAPSIVSLGGAPAIQIGSDTQAITLGVAGTGNDAYGFVNRGTVTGSGVYAGVNARALQLGTASGQSVTVDGGVRNEGTITASAKDADATTIWINSGVTTPTLINTNTIQAGVVGTGDHTATAVQIGAGANLPSFTNSGSISSAINGDKGTVYGIRDLSGSLTEFTNKGNLVVGFVSNADNSTAADRQATAIDLSANTTGVTIRQTAPDQPADTKEEDKKSASIVGNIKLGDGNDLVSIENGTVVGDIAFGAGADRLNISGGSTVSGAITASDGQLDINVSKGTLNATQTTASSISNLNIGADGTLIVMLDPAANKTGGFNVSGNATLADGAALGVRFNSLLAGPQKFAIIEAGTLNVGNINQEQLTANSPYLYVVTPDVDLAAGKIYIDARRRTAAEANLIPVEASAFDAVYGALGSNEALKNLFLSRTNRDDFMDVYQQMLPDHSGGPLMSLSAGVDAVTRALTGRNATAAPGETSAWVQEINFYADKDKTDSYGFRSEGFGIAGGVEKGTNLGAFGISAAFTSSDIKEPESKAEETLSASLLELGLYWRAQGQYWTTWA
ncbi:autotransporter outer membrane beta-barrel domain-containing protein, partial [Brevundimonas nasdae]|uniref:autotransporter outer membrane beta-barrel domain-containing protein n=1 Tax=Brevundimonas nasdae TaxID=172043 RepID=UPI002896A272